MFDAPLYAVMNANLTFKPVGDMSKSDNHFFLFIGNVVEYDMRRGMSERDCFPGNNGVIFDKVQKERVNRKKKKRNCNVYVEYIKAELLT